jgi:hypothetical protein
MKFLGKYTKHQNKYLVISKFSPAIAQGHGLSMAGER